MTDFKFFVQKWIPSRNKSTLLFDSLRNIVVTEQPDLVIITHIPRHHAKKLQNKEWLKDYFISKESRSITEDRAISYPIISVAFYKYPFSSEEWFPLDKNGFAHIIEVCIPLGAWHPSRSPLLLLQEYQLTYDEVSTFSFVIAVNTHDINSLKETFRTENLRNAVFFILDKGIADNKIINNNFKDLDIEFQPSINNIWKILNNNGLVVALTSTLGEYDDDSLGGAGGDGVGGDNKVDGDNKVENAI